MAGLDRAALAGLRRLHETADVGAWGVDFGRHLTADGAGVAMASDRRVVELAAASLNALPALLALAERAAALDPALLARLEERYAADPEPGPCKKCGGSLKEFCRVDGQVQWLCRNHCIAGVRYTEAGDPEVIRLVAWARGLAGGEGDGVNGERKEQGE